MPTKNESENPAPAVDSQKILSHISTFHDELTAIRRDIHAHPELGFEEERTSALVAEKLEGWGIDVTRGLGRTGVIGTLRCGNAPRSIGLRADMDALPITEDSGDAYASQTPGVMHACGHDGHTAMLLGTARYLAETRNFEGTVHFIFQPAEEAVGGARQMLADGLFEQFPCDAVYGIHNRPGLALGSFGIRPGPMMAGGAVFDIEISGVGAHGARPESGLDPIPIAAQIITATQTIVSRNVPPQDTAVISITGVHGGDAYNVIPPKVRLMGTARAFKPEVMKQLETGLRRIAQDIAKGMGGEASLDFREEFLPLVNDPAEAAFAADCAASLVGEGAVDRNRPIIMGSEDFSFMLAACPGAYINIGIGEDHPTQVHNPAYRFNDAVLPTGSAYLASLVENKLAES